MSIKELAKKVLQRNLKGNSSETPAKEEGNLKGKCYKVYSELLEAYLWVVDTDQDMHFLRSQGISEAIYTRHEIGELKKLPKEALKDIHTVKEVFEKSKIEEVKTKREEL